MIKEIKNGMKQTMNKFSQKIEDMQRKQANNYTTIEKTNDKIVEYLK